MILRTITPLLLAALKNMPVVFLQGIRKSGKTALIQEIMREISTKKAPVTYISFNRPTHIAAAVAPEAFLIKQENNLIIEEVQLMPEMFPAIKDSIDQLQINNTSKVKGRYLLTGSSDTRSFPKLSGLLVHKMTVLTLYPLSTAEASGGKGDGLDRIWKLNFSGLIDTGLSITAAIRSASFPEIGEMGGKERSSWFDTYLTTILQHDVRQLAGLERIAVLPALLRVLAARAGSLVNESDIAREVGLNSVTGKLYRNMLKTLFLNFDVQSWSGSSGKRLVKAPKSYLADTLMLCHMFDLNLKDIQKNKPDLFARVLENYVATELVKLLSFSSTKAQLLHFRTSDNKKVDFILQKPDGSLFAIDIKNSASVTIQDFKGISIFSEAAGKDFAGGIVLYMGKQVVSFGRNLWGIPLYLLWQ